MKEIKHKGNVLEFDNDELELLMNALLVRVKTFRVSLKKTVSFDVEDNFRSVIEKDEKGTYDLLVQLATARGISKEWIDHNLEHKNPWMREFLKRG